MARRAAAHRRRRHGGRTAVIEVDQATARRIARAAPRSGVVVDPLKVSDLARVAGCHAELMRRAIRAGIRENLTATRDGAAE